MGEKLTGYMRLVFWNLEVALKPELGADKAQELVNHWKDEVARGDIVTEARKGEYMHCKVFVGVPANIEEQIQDWLKAEQNCEIRHVCVSTAVLVAVVVVLWERWYPV